MTSLFERIDEALFDLIEPVGWGTNRMPPDNFAAAMARVSLLRGLAIPLLIAGVASLVCGFGATADPSVYAAVARRGRRARPGFASFSPVNPQPRSSERFLAVATWFVQAESRLPKPPLRVLASLYPGTPRKVRGVSICDLFRLSPGLAIAGIGLCGRSGSQVGPEGPRFFRPADASGAPSHSRTTAR